MQFINLCNVVLSKFVLVKIKSCKYYLCNSLYFHSKQQLFLLFCVIISNIFQFEFRIKYILNKVENENLKNYIIKNEDDII